MLTRIWHGATPEAKSDEYLNLMRTVAIPDYRSTPGNKGAYALRRMEGDTAHFLMVTFWESEETRGMFAAPRSLMASTKNPMLMPKTWCGNGTSARQRKMAAPYPWWFLWKFTTSGTRTET